MVSTLGRYPDSGWVAPFAATTPSLPGESRVLTLVGGSRPIDVPLSGPRGDVRSVFLGDSRVDRLASDPPPPSPRRPRYRDSHPLLVHGGSSLLLPNSVSAGRRAGATVEVVVARLISTQLV